MLFYTDVGDNVFTRKVEEELLKEYTPVMINQFIPTPDGLVVIDFDYKEEPREVTVYTHINGLTVDESVNEIMNLTRSL
mgnify:FL=1